MAYSDGPSGVGGWMYLFLFGFSFLTPVRLLFETYSNMYGNSGVAAAFGSNWLLYQICAWMLIGLSLALIAYIVWRLFKVQNPRTPQLTVIAVPLVVFGPTLLDLLLSSFFLAIEWDKVWQALAPSLAQGVIYCVIWCTYFKISKRVKNTYADRSGEEAAEVFE
jgi:hypothetical protein